MGLFKKKKKKNPKTLHHVRKLHEQYSWSFTFCVKSSKGKCLIKTFHHYLCVCSHLLPEYDMYLYISVNNKGDQ